jgi:site-specific DNA-methyltransferase (adenine-specific)
MQPYYEEKGITIYHGDCLEALSSLESSTADMVFTSPPYNLSAGNRPRMGHKGSTWYRAALANGYGNHNDAMPYPEYVEWQKSTLKECWRIIDDAGAIFYNHKPRVQEKILQTPLALNPDLPLRQIIIWTRSGGLNYSFSHYMPAHEWILIFAKEKFELRDKAASGVSDVWAITQEMNNPHPAPFPIGLPRLALQTTKAQAVVDPFMGSGTVLRAAKDLGRQAIGIDND